MWLLGGADDSSPAIRNDVWSSADGVNWTLECDYANYPARVGGAALVLDDRIYVLGGSNGEFLGDVWSSADGKNWMLETDSAPWGPRSGFAAVVYGGMIWLMGGFMSLPDDQNDVWRSADGRDWTLVTDSVPWTRRSNLAALTQNGRVWMLGGTGRNASYPRDVWYSSGLGVSEGCSPGGGASYVRTVPNPFRRRVVLECGARHDARVRVVIRNCAGSVVREFERCIGDQGTKSVTWDGCDGQGWLVPAGVYLVTLTNRGSNAMCRLVKLP